MAWSVACAVLFYWLLSFAALNLTNAQHNPTVYHYVHKYCPTPTAGR